MGKDFTNLEMFVLIFILIILGNLNYHIIGAGSFEKNDISHLLHFNSFDLEFNETNAYDHISTQLGFGFRVPGTSAHTNCSNWIISQMQSTTSLVSTHEFIIQKEGEPSYNCQNILGKINPDRENIVIFGAHWDSRNISEKALTNREKPIPGANDGGSGVGVLIELARVLSLYQSYLDSQIWFLFIDAEDQGYTQGMYGIQGWEYCEGSRVFIEEIDDFYDSSSESFECFILLDMVGGTNLEFIKESRSDDDLHESIFNEGRALGYIQSFPSEAKSMVIKDDHLAFMNIGMPVIDLIIDFIYGEWTYHHTLSDDLSNIDPESLKITGRTLESFIKTYYTTGTEQNWRDEFPKWLYISLFVGSGLLLVIVGIVLKKRIWAGNSILK